MPVCLTCFAYLCGAVDDNIIIRFYDMLDHILFDVNPCDTDEKTRPKKKDLKMPKIVLIINELKF